MQYYHVLFTIIGSLQMTPPPGFSKPDFNYKGIRVRVWVRVRVRVRVRVSTNPTLTL